MGIVLWDTVAFAFNLFDSDIKPIQEDQHMLMVENNAMKDGSIDYDKFIQLIGGHRRRSHKHKKAHKR